jgi:hypothetical protein
MKEFASALRQDLSGLLIDLLAICGLPMRDETAKGIAHHDVANELALSQHIEIATKNLSLTKEQVDKIRHFPIRVVAKRKADET